MIFSTAAVHGAQGEPATGFHGVSPQKQTAAVHLSHTGTNGPGARLAGPRAGAPSFSPLTNQ